MGSFHMILSYVWILPIRIFGGCGFDVLHRKSTQLARGFRRQAVVLGMGTCKKALSKI